MSKSNNKPLFLGSNALPYQDDKSIVALAIALAIAALERTVPLCGRQKRSEPQRNEESVFILMTKEEANGNGQKYVFFWALCVRDSSGCGSPCGCHC
jgi:hypothetical protein